MVDAKDILEQIHRLDSVSSGTRYLDKIKTITGQLREAAECCDDTPKTVIECGAYRGAITVMLSATMLDLGLFDKGWSLQVYDTFEGMPASTSEKNRKLTTGRGPVHEGHLSCDISTVHTNIYDSLVNLGLVDYDGYNPDPFDTGVTFIKGMVEDTVTALPKNSVAFASFDTDYYESTKHLFDTIPQSMVRGGRIYVDDYFCWQGARDATDEFLGSNPEFSGDIQGQRYFFVKKDEDV